MKFMVQRATTRGNQYSLYEEERLVEKPPIEGAVKDTDVSTWNNYHPWIIEFDTMEDLLQLINTEKHSIVIGEFDSQEYETDKYDYCITIYDGYLE